MTDKDVLALLPFVSTCEHGRRIEQFSTEGTTGSWALIAQYPCEDCGNQTVARFEEPPRHVSVAGRRWTVRA